MEKEHVVHNLDTCPICGEKYCAECHKTYNTLPDHDGTHIIFLEEHRCGGVKPKPDTTRALPQYPNKAEQTISDGVAYKTPSSERLKEEFNDKFTYIESHKTMKRSLWNWETDAPLIEPDIIWNWILSHAKEIGSVR